MVRILWNHFHLIDYDYTHANVLISCNKHNHVHECDGEQHDDDPIYDQLDAYSDIDQHHADNLVYLRWMRRGNCQSEHRHAGGWRASVRRWI